MEKINYNLANKIKKHIKNGERPLIIVISGINGVGKTTLAFHLSNILDIKQRIGLGAIVKTLIAMEPKNKDFFKMNNYFSSLSVTDLQNQSLIISKVINFMIRKYNTGGVSCIIEGVQLLTRHLDNKIIQFHILVTDSKKYRKQLKNSDTRKPRNVSDKEFINLLKVNQILKKEMNFPTVCLLDNSKSLVAIVNKMLEDIAINLNIK
jgi:2-phosphoglycerate kinase